MSDTVKKWHEMQEEKILSDQGGKYTVPNNCLLYTSDAADE